MAIDRAGGSKDSRTSADRALKAPQWLKFWKRVDGARSILPADVGRQMGIAQHAGVDVG